MIRVSHSEWLHEAKRRYPNSTYDIAFRCPSCGFVQSVADFIELGMSFNDAATIAGVSCIGRWMTGVPIQEMCEDGPGPCNYTGHGLICISPIAVATGDDTELPVFDFADEPLETSVRAVMEVENG